MNIVRAGVLLSLALLSSTNVLALNSISCNDAIQTAEKFVKEQGYTDVPVSITHDEIVFESLEWGGNPDEILAKRKGTLNSKARGAYDDKKKWVVFFSYKDPSIGASRGRAVRLEKNGKDAIVEHQDADLSHSTISCS